MKSSALLKALPLLAFCLLFLKKGAAQPADTLVLADLQPVTVTAFRLEQSDLAAPLALTTIGSFRLQHGQQQLALNEALAAVPGVWVQNADNFAQDVRVSIRGFGARSAFGIRGIKILLDGFPETSPDGQGQVDNIEPGAVESVRVIRGATAGLHGNASGGSIHFSTLRFDGREFAEGSASGGAFGFQKYQLKAGGGSPRMGFFHVAASHTRTDGYRQQSAMKNYLLNGGVRFLATDSSGHLTLAFNYANSPLAQDAGGVELDSAVQEPRLARYRNIQFDAGEAVRQGRLGFSFSKRFSKKGRFVSNTWVGQRKFSNKLPFQAGGIVELERFFFGINGSFELQGKLFGLPHRASFGLDVETQKDDRSRFANLDGERGDPDFRQLEKFSSYGIFLAEQLDLHPRFSASLALRGDLIRLEAGDRFLADGDDSGERRFERFNPLLGFTFAASESLRLYANAATSFETPTLSELSANPVGGGGGFNPGLDPQRAASFELGAKGLLRSERLRWDAALFHIRLTDEFAPYELPAFPGRTFFRNAASSRRSGVEAGLGSYLGAGFYAYAHYTFSDFQFADYQTAAGDFGGKNLPGVPRHLAYAEVRYFKKSGLHGTVTVQRVGTQHAADANEVEVESYWLANARLGWQLVFEKWLVEPFAGANNLFDADYFSNLRINAAGGRHFEPGAGANVFGGVRVRVAGR